MNQTTHHHDDMDFDARLTAYALGELEPDDAAAIEAALESNDDARQALAEIRQTAEQLGAALANEPAPGLTDDQRRTIESGPAPAPLNHPGIFRMRSLWIGTGALAAAAVGLALILPYFQNGGLPAASSSSDEMAIRMGKEQAGDQSVRSFVLKTPDDASQPRQESARRDTRDTAIAAPGGRGGGRGLASADPAAPAVEMLADRVAAPPALRRPEPFASSLEEIGAHGDLAVVEKSYATGTRPKGEVDADVLDAPSRGRDELREMQQRLSELANQAPPVDREQIEAEPEELLAAGGRSREGLDHIVENAFVRVTDAPFSTFSIDVDTASYANVRRFLNEGRLPPRDAVRIEELVNYFHYDYEPPTAGDADPFAVHVEVNAAPWAPAHRLVKIGLKGREIDADMRPATNLVFLLDVSGSMKARNKLPLVKRSMLLLLDELNADDRVAIVTYAGQAGVALESTYVAPGNRERVEHAINALGAGGSTNGAGGIIAAYDLAQSHFIEGGVNRVILCTDGDFNVGVSSDGELVRLIEDKRRTGVFLSVFGFGRGNVQMAKMEKLAQNGNGVFGYIDSIDEARKAFVDELAGTLVTIAKDVKIQVEFNPTQVGAYRLLGYENRMLAVRDFRDDAKDAGEIGAGHTVTAFYEIVPAGAEADVPAAPERRYAEPAGADVPADVRHELLTVRLRYKQPEGEVATELARPVIDHEAGPNDASADFQFASSVAAFGLVLRDSAHKGGATLSMVLDLADSALRGGDEDSLRDEFVSLVERARVIAGE